ncbi:MAG: urease accessory protein UreF [Burkholderiales bacterium]|nr:urease accessory protein UreF [Burkholderiales bacterium]
MPNADLALVRLLQLASPALPVGAYSYSQGLEAAVEAGIVNDAISATRWLTDVLRYSMGSFEAPLCWRMLQAWQAHDVAQLADWNGMLIAGRETSETRAETLQMGYSLARLLTELDDFPEPQLSALKQLDAISYPAAFSCAAIAWEIPAQSALLGYLWSWIENQSLAALKCVPLGQAAGQRILLHLGALLPSIAQHAMTTLDLSNFAPGLAMLSCKHEKQYTRLFRS